MEEQNKRVGQLSFVSKVMIFITLVIGALRSSSLLEIEILLIPSAVMFVVTIAYIRKVTPAYVFIKDLKQGENS